MQRLVFTVAMLSVTLLALTTVDAQDAVAGIQASGTSTIERPAEVMRMQVEILAKSSKDLPDALAKLKTRRAKVEKVLESLGADKKAIKFGELRIDDTQDDTHRRMEMMVQQRLMQRGRKPPKEVIAKPVRVGMQLIAEWPLKEGDATSQIIETKKLQDAIKGADLGGVKETEEQTAEEIELEEEMEGPPLNTWGGENQVKPGEPRFTFAAKIPVAIREKALADAFGMARAEAEQLAKAAMIGVGRLQSIRTTVSPDPEEFEVYRQYGYQYRGRPGEADTDEAIGSQPGILKLRVGVAAVFAIQ